MVSLVELGRLKLELMINMRADCWSRSLIKQTYETLRPKRSFISHHPTGIPIHGPKTIPNGCEWYEMGFIVHWDPPQASTVLCFDAPLELIDLLENALARNNSQTVYKDPCSPLCAILDGILVLYDSSVWSMRNHVCGAEAVCL